MQDSNYASGIPRRMFFVDSENGAELLLTGYSDLHSSDTIIMFHRNNVSNKVREQLDCALVKVEWIKCGDPKIKNSMDFHIVAELGLRLATNSFEEGYVVSADKGFQAAVHHLKNQPIAQGRILKCVRDIEHALYPSAMNALVNLQEAKCSDDIQKCFEVVLSKNKSKKIMEKLIDIIGHEVTERATQYVREEPTLAVYELPCEEAEVSNFVYDRRDAGRRFYHFFLGVFNLRNVASVISRR